MRKVNLAIALMFAGSAAFAGLARAEKPSAISQAQAVTDAASDTPEIQHLRQARKDLNAAKDAFEKDDKDKADHRKEILEGIDKAITAIDAEIDELKGK